MICPHCSGTGEVDALEVKNSGLTLERLQLEAWFAAFWQLYPRHVGKASALKAWKKAATSEAVKDAIMAAVADQKRHWERMLQKDKWNKVFIPHAATWLNQRRWDDEVEGLRPGGQPRVIACELCGDTGLIGWTTHTNDENGNPIGLRRCSCARGALPGLVIPQAEETPF